MQADVDKRKKFKATLACPSISRYIAHNIVIRGSISVVVCRAVHNATGWSMHAFPLPRISLIMLLQFCSLYMLLIAKFIDGSTGQGKTIIDFNPHWGPHGEQVAVNERATRYNLKRSILVLVCCLHGWRASTRECNWVQQIDWLLLIRLPITEPALLFCSFHA